jgi:hypothetical protein
MSHYNETNLHHSLSFTGKPVNLLLKEITLQPSQEFACKARSLAKSVAPDRCFTRVSSGHTHKLWIWLERLVKDKRSSLLQKFVNYGRKKF